MRRFFRNPFSFSTGHERRYASTSSATLAGDREEEPTVLSIASDESADLTHFYEQCVASLGHPYLPNTFAQPVLQQFESQLLDLQRLRRSPWFIFQLRQARQSQQGIWRSYESCLNNLLPSHPLTTLEDETAFLEAAQRFVVAWLYLNALGRLQASYLLPIQAGWNRLDAYFERLAAASPDRAWPWIHHSMSRLQLGRGRPDERHEAYWALRLRYRTYYDQQLIAYLATGGAEQEETFFSRWGAVYAFNAELQQGSDNFCRRNDPYGSATSRAMTDEMRRLLMHSLKSYRDALSQPRRLPAFTLRAQQQWVLFWEQMVNWCFPGQSDRQLKRLCRTVYRQCRNQGVPTETQSTQYLRWNYFSLCHQLVCSEEKQTQRQGSGRSKQLRQAQRYLLYTLQTATGRCFDQPPVVGIQIIQQGRSGQLEPIVHSFLSQLANFLTDRQSPLLRQLISMRQQGLRLQVDKKKAAGALDNLALCQLSEDSYKACMKEITGFLAAVLHEWLGQHRIFVSHGALHTLIPSVLKQIDARFNDEQSIEHLIHESLFRQTLRENRDLHIKIKNNWLALTAVNPRIVFKQHREDVLSLIKLLLRAVHPDKIQETVASEPKLACYARQILDLKEKLEKNTLSSKDENDGWLALRDAVQASDAFLCIEGFKLLTQHSKAQVADLTQLSLLVVSDPSPDNLAKLAAFCQLPVGATAVADQHNAATLPSSQLSQKHAFFNKTAEQEKPCEQPRKAAADVRLAQEKWLKAGVGAITEKREELDCSFGYPTGVFFSRLTVTRKKVVRRATDHQMHQSRIE